MLTEVEKMLASSRYVGGGVPVWPERWSVGIFFSWLFLFIAMFVTRLGGGSYWLYRRDFEAVHGFNERVIVAEDLEFAGRLRDHGKKTGRRFTTLWHAGIRTSCRKFDHFGDWIVLRMLLRPRKLTRIVKGQDQRFADRFFYDFER